jgi:hypothetical protein
MHDGIADIAQNVTEDHNRAAKALRPPLGTGTDGLSPYLALSDLVRKWPQSSVRMEVPMISSGADPMGGFVATNPYLDIAIDHAQLGGVIVYAIYTPRTGHIGHSFLQMNWGQNYPARLAEETGGESIHARLSVPDLLRALSNGRCGESETPVSDRFHLETAR